MTTCACCGLSVGNDYIAMADTCPSCLTSPFVAEHGEAFGLPELLIMATAEWRHRGLRGELEGMVHLICRAYGITGPKAIDRIRTKIETGAEDE